MVRILRKEDWFPPDGFPIVVARRDPQEPFGLHAHEFAEVVIITGGTGLHVTGKETWPLIAGDVFVIGGDRPHDYQDMDGLRLINILFDPTQLRVDLGDLPALAGYHALFTLEPAWRQRHQFKSRLHLAPKDLGHVIGIVDELEEELSRREAGFRFLATALYMQLIGYLSRCYTRSRNPDSRASCAWERPFPIWRPTSPSRSIWTNWPAPPTCPNEASSGRFGPPWEPRRSII